MSATSQELAAREGRQVEKARKGGALLPPVDIIEDEDGIALLADMPGVSTDGLDIQVDDQVLSIEGEIKLDVPADAEATFAEVRGMRYERRFTLSRELDPNKIEAHLSNGVLSLRVPKRAEHKPRRIEINA